MSASTTVAIGEDFTGAINGLLKGFPKGSRVRVTVTEDPPTLPTQTTAIGVDEFRRRVAEARRQAPRSPWKTSADAMKELREGEQG